jgi:hypothetical protein
MLAPALFIFFFVKEENARDGQLKFFYFFFSKKKCETENNVEKKNIKTKLYFFPKDKQLRLPLLLTIVAPSEKIRGSIPYEKIIIIGSFFFIPPSPITKQSLQKRPKFFLKGFTEVFLFFPKRKKKKHKKDQKNVLKLGRK